MTLKLLIGVAGLAVAPMAMAQDGKEPAAVTEPVVDAEAKEFIAKFRAAIKGVKDLSCTVEQTTTADGKTETFRGEVIATIVRPPTGNGSGMVQNFRITAKGEKGDTVWAFDGKNAARIDHGSKTFATMEAPEGQAFPVMAASQVYPSWSLRDVLSDPTAKIVAAKLLPDVTLNGVECKGVEYTVEIPMRGDPDSKMDQGKMTLTQVRHVGAVDLLPRKIESTVMYSGPLAEQMGVRKFTGIFTDMRANTKPVDSVFALKEPTGYRTVEVDAQDLGVPSNEPPKMKFAANDVAPPFALKTPAGTEVTLASLKGKVVLLDFWATWCGPCIAAMPSIQKLHEKYEGKPVAILGVNTWERGAADLAQKFMEKRKFTYGLLLKGDELATAYGISGIPTLVLIGPDGKIIHIGVGFGPGEEEHLASLIDKALAGK